MLQKKRWDFVQNSPFLIPRYFQRQENTIPRSKIFPTKNVAKHKERFRTVFTIRSKIFPKIEKYNSQVTNSSYKKCCKKRGGILYRIHHSQFQNISRDRKIQSLEQKYFLHKMLEKRGGISYRIHHCQFQNISTDRKI